MKPIIDRLVIIYNLEDFVSDKADELKAYIEHSMKFDGINDPAYKSVDYGLLGKYPYKYYARNTRLIHEPSGQSILIQAMPFKEGTPFLRFDLNPSLLARSGVEFFKQKLKEDFSLPDALLDFDLMAQQGSSIKRLDIAVDILGADVSDMVIQPCVGGKPKPHKSHSYTGSTGRDQTKYLKAGKGKRSNSYVYNKKVELQENDNPPLYGEALHSRFEYRMGKTVYSLYDLGGNVHNHLKKVDIKLIDYASFADKDFTHIFFMQYVRARGRYKAMELIPSWEDKETFKDTYQKGLVNIWKPIELWEHWPEALKYYGLLDD